VQANIYLTPPGAQGFRVHFDTHDVLVMQVSGAKSWRVWDDIPFPLPSRATPWANKESPAGVPHALTLNPGGALYLPRGVMHEAAAQTGDAPSLHITLGFLEASIADILRELLEILEAENPSLRASIPSWRLAEPHGTAAIAARLAPALAALSSEAAQERLALAAMDRITRDRLPLSQRSLAHRPPGADAKLRLSDAMHHHLVPLPEGGGALRWYGGVENMNATECAWLAQLAEGATPADLGEGALAFCQRLAALGLLEPD
jgi:ribosomal protein L16 Arg81 hydroxylase